MKRNVFLALALVVYLPAVSFAQKVKYVEPVVRVFTGKQIPSHVFRSLEPALQRAIATQGAIPPVPAAAPSTYAGVPEFPEFKKTKVAGLGTVRKVDLGGPNGPHVSYGLNVPTRRGHTDTWVSMDLLGVVRRVINSHRYLDFGIRWLQENKPLHYVDLQDLAKDLHAFYEGKGVRVKNLATDLDAIMYIIPSDHILYALPGEEARILDGKKYVMMFYPKIQAGELVPVDEEHLLIPFTLLTEESL